MITMRRLKIVFEWKDVYTQENGGVVSTVLARCEVEAQGEADSPEELRRAEPAIYARDVYPQMQLRPVVRTFVVWQGRPRMAFDEAAQLEAIARAIAARITEVRDG